MRNIEYFLNMKKNSSGFVLFLPTTQDDLEILGRVYYLDIMALSNEQKKITDYIIPKQLASCAAV